MIEEDIEGIKSELVSLRCMIQEIHEKVIPEKNNPSENTEKETKLDKNLNDGDYPRYCACGNKLGSNKEKGICKKCEKKKITKFESFEGKPLGNLQKKED